jgi:hypothetical protein
LGVVAPLPDPYVAGRLTIGRPAIVNEFFLFSYFY